MAGDIRRAASMETHIPASQHLLIHFASVRLLLEPYMSYFQSRLIWSLRFYLLSVHSPVSMANWPLYSHVLPMIVVGAKPFWNRLWWGKTHQNMKAAIKETLDRFISLFL